MGIRQPLDPDMKTKIHLALLILLVPLLPLKVGAQELTPLIPMGNLSAFPTIVQAGTHPTLTWEVTLPERVTDVVTIHGAGTVVPNRDLIVDIRVIGVPVKNITTDSNGNVTEWNWAPTEARMSYNGGSYDQIFYNIHENVNPNYIAALGDVTAGSTLNFGGRHVTDSGNWGPFQSSTNSLYNVVALKDGDAIPTATPILEHPNLQDFLLPYLDTEGRVNLGARDVLVLVELTETNSNNLGFDLQDLALLLTFYDQATSGDAGSETSTEPGIKTNNGHGNNADGVDSSNPGNAPFTDTDPTNDDEVIRRGRRIK